MSIEKDRVSIGQRVWTRGRSLDLSVLFAAREKEFTGPGGPSYYETAAALVSLLLDRNWPYGARYARYVEALVEGKRHDAAWTEAFGDVSVRRLQEDLLQYRRDGFVDTVAEPYRASAPPEPSVRYLSDVDIHLLWMRLRRDGRGMRHDLEEARREEPGSPEVAMYCGLIAEADERYDEAEADLRAARDAAPNDERSGLALFAYHLRRAKATRAPFEPLARRALALRPHRFGYLDTLALVLFEEGEVEEALATQERAMALLPDGAKQPEMAEHLELYQKRVAEKRAASPRAGGVTSRPK